MTKITIITTTYRHQDFIAETIESVLMQTYTNRELLIGDDSPDDETRKIIQEYVTRYPKKIKARHHKPNKGIVDNMNFLLKKISLDSTYVAFLEGDDLFTSNNLQKKIEIFTHYPDVKLVYNDISVIDKFGRILSSHYILSHGFNIIQNQNYSIKLHIPSYSCTMVSIESLKSIGGIPKTSLGNNYSSDSVFHEIMSKKYLIYGISEDLTLYRKHGNNASSDLYTLGSGVINDIDWLYNNNYINQQEHDIRMGRIMLTICFYLLSIGQKKRAINYINKSMKYKGHYLLKTICIFLCILPFQGSRYICNFYYKIYNQK